MPPYATILNTEISISLLCLKPWLLYILFPINETNVPKKILKNVWSSSSGKLKNSIFEIPIFPQILKITGAKPINLIIIRKLIKYCVKTVFTLTICLRYCSINVGLIAGYRKRKGKMLRGKAKKCLAFVGIAWKVIVLQA